MFNQLFQKTSALKRHINAPLLQERQEYLQYKSDCGASIDYIRLIAPHLLLIITYLALDTINTITIDDIEQAADRWVKDKLMKSQHNNLQKNVAPSKTGKKRFILYAKDWLRKLNRLELPPEERISLFSNVFQTKKALKRHYTEPLLTERLSYLQYIANNGAADSTIRTNAQYLLAVMKYLNFYELRMVSLKEIESAANEWARTSKSPRRKGDYSKAAEAIFISKASNWFKMLNCLELTIKDLLPFEEYLNQYVEYIRHEKGLSEKTIRSKRMIIRDFLNNINKKIAQFINITPLIISEILIKKHEIDCNSRKTVQLYASIIREFLRYAENQEWCQCRLADSIKSPRVYTQESLPSAPNWDDVKEIISLTNTDLPTDIRDYAILMLLSVYGMRCSEVTNLCLEDLDWQNELLYIKRAKRTKPQIFPLSKTVGEAILRYLKEVRPNKCSLREVFIRMRSPYKPLSNTGVYRVVSKKLKSLNLQIQHYGAHTLRHACATHLINDGFSLKEISNHLGHQRLETTRIYTKVDLTNLRKVAEFELGDII